MRLVPKREHPMEAVKDLPDEPLRTLEWIREHVLADLPKEAVSDQWLRSNLPCVRINRRTRLYYESRIKEWLRERSDHAPTWRTPQ